MDEEYFISRYSIHFGNNQLINYILSIQLAIFGLIGLDLIGIEIPIIRQVISFIYLTFIPGILIIRILKFQRSNSMEALLFSVGLSMSFLIFIGILMNYFYPLFGISNPISEFPLMITISCIVLILCYLVDKKCSIYLSINAKQIFSPYVLSLLLIPFIAIFGTYLLNYHNSNFLLLLLLAIISIIPIIIVFDKINEEIYPLAIWSISISLLFHSVLLTQEKLFENSIIGLVARNGYWDTSVGYGQFALPTVTTLIPTYSAISGMDILPSFYIIYPLLYSVTPVVLYMIFKSQTKGKIAFLSSFLFMSIFAFYMSVGRAIRSGIAELFLALIVLLLVSKNIRGIINSFLMIVFSLSLILSHYATSYMYMMSIPISMLMYSILRIKDTVFEKKSSIKQFSLNYAYIFIVFCIVWYMFNASSIYFIYIVRFFFDHIPSVLENFVNPNNSYLAYGAIQNYQSTSIEIIKYLYFFACFSIGIGVLLTLYRRIFKKISIFNDQYLSLCAAFLGIFILSLMFSGGFAAFRGFSIVLILLAPFSIIGFAEICNFFLTFMLKVSKPNLNDSIPLLFFATLLCILLLLESGFVSETIMGGKDYAPSVLISKNRLVEHNIETIEDVMIKSYLYGFYTPEYDINTIMWLVMKSNKEKPIFNDDLGQQTRFRMVGDFATVKNNGFTYIQQLEPLREDMKFTEVGYMVLFYHNIREKIIITDLTPFKYVNSSSIEKKADMLNKIYSNGWSEVMSIGV